MESELDRNDLRVYELIWKRTMASQMVDARVLRTSVEISGAGVNGETAVFTASGKAIEFAGFRRAYVEGSDDPAAELEEQETILPQCSVGDRIDRAGTAVTLLGAESKRHETTPPARFTATSAKIADSTIATAVAANGATAGSYSLEVTNLASAQNLVDTIKQQSGVLDGSLQSGDRF